jgi:N-acetylglucosaminyl-diphospho-decaprenol L-rhamnosyltransferase
VITASLRAVESDPVREYGDALAAVTVTRRGRPALEGLRATLPEQLPLVVVDTASSERGGDAVRLPEDVGWAAAVNRGVAGLAREVGWVVLTAPGVRWRPGAVDALRAAAVRHPRAGLLGPAQHGATGRTGGPVPRLRDAVRGRIPGPAGPGPTGWLSSAALLVQRSAWDSVDGFDARYLDGPGGFCDIDLGDRMGRAGWLVVFVPDVVIDVEPGDTIVDGHGILEPHAAGLHRFVRDRARGPARALAALARRAL